MEASYIMLDLIKGHVEGHVPQWLYEEVADDIDVDLLRKELWEHEPHLPWEDFTEAQDLDTEVATAWKDATESQSNKWSKEYTGATRGRKAKLRDYDGKKYVEMYAYHIKKKYNLIGGTIAMQDPRTTYAWHTDKCMGFQVPIITNKDCAFIFRLGDNTYSFTPKEGRAYLVNNFVPHTFMNGGAVDRYMLLHIINPPHLNNTRYNDYLETSGWTFDDYQLSREYS